jgi:hypothetical protein
MEQETGVSPKNTACQIGYTPSGMMVCHNGWLVSSGLHSMNRAVGHGR